MSTQCRVSAMLFFFSSRRRHTRLQGDWSSDVCSSDLSAAEAHRRLVASLTTPISLIKHAAAAERIWFQRFWAGLDESECDGYSNRDEGTFAVADDESLADVIAEFERASQRSRVIASRFDLDDTKDNPREGTVSMRWTLLAMIEECARHAGHGDILREQIDQPTPRHPNR